MNFTPSRAAVRIVIGVSIATALCLGSASSALAEPKGNSAECANLEVYYSQDQKALDEAHRSGNQKAIRQARSRVFDDINAAYALGCSWVS